MKRHLAVALCSGLSVFARPQISLPSDLLPGGVPGVVTNLLPGGVPGVVTNLLPGGVPGVVTNLLPGGVPGVVTNLLPGGVPGVITAIVPGGVPAVVTAVLPGGVTSLINVILPGNVTTLITVSTISDTTATTSASSSTSTSIITSSSTAIALPTPITSSTTTSSSTSIITSRSTAIVLPTPTALNTFVPDRVYQGCFVDVIGDTPLLTGTAFLGITTLTQDGCKTRCTGFQYFGIDNGVDCRCGNTLTNPVTSALGECNTATSGSVQSSVLAARDDLLKRQAPLQLEQGGGLNRISLWSDPAFVNPNKALFLNDRDPYPPGDGVYDNGYPGKGDYGGGGHRGNGGGGHGDGSGGHHGGGRGGGHGRG